MRILSNKKGITFFIVIAILAILLIAITSYNSMLRSERYTMYRIIYGDNALIIAEAAMDLLQRIVEYEFALTGYERKNTYFKYEDLIKPKGEFKTVNFDSTKLTDVISNSDPIKALIEIFGGSSIAKVKKVEVTIDEKNVKYFGDVSGQSPNIVPNLHEKFGIITYSVQVEYYGITKTLNISKQIKIINVLPKVLRHFTFFIKNIPKGTDLNKILVDDSGVPINGKPLVLYNGEYNSPSSLSPLDQGMIFLGNQPASEPLILKMSHGDSTSGVGELFHLIRKFYLDKEFQRRYENSKGYQVGHTEYGVSSGMANARYFGIQTPKDLLSSMLKLYCTPAAPSPTRILGNVNRCYLRLGAYQDKQTNGTEHMGDMTFSTPATFTTAGVPPITEVDADTHGLLDEGGKLKPVTAEWIAKKILPDELGGMDLYNAYAEFMNQFIDYEPYNYSMLTPIKDKNGVDCDPNKIPDFKTKLFPSGSNSYGGNPAKPADEEYTGSDLRMLSLDEKYAIPYASYKFSGDKEFTDFKKLFMNGSQTDALKLGLATTFEGDIRLPQMTIQKGGMIICKKGNITISGDITADPVYNQTLAIIAMDGDIIVDAKKVDAILISLKDGLKFEPKNSLDISGTLAATSMDFDKLLTTGGKISYRPCQAVPTNDTNFYYASIQPDVRNWKVILDNDKK